MPAITLNIPVLGINAICERYGYQPTIDGQPNPQSKAEFVKQWLTKDAMTAIKEHIANTAAANAAKTAATDADTNIVIT